MYGNAQDVKFLTGVKPSDVGAADDAELTSVIDAWIAEVSSIIDGFLGDSAPADPSAPSWDGVKGVCERTVANIVAVARQQRTQPIVQVDSFAVEMLNASDATKHVERELKAFLSEPATVSVFSSLTDDETLMTRE